MHNIISLRKTMNKLYSRFLKGLLCFFIIFVIGNQAYAEGLVIDGDFKYYTYTNGTASILGFADTSISRNNLTIPGKLTHNGTTYTVTSVNLDAFRGAKISGSLTIEEGIKVIGDAAFEYTDIKAIYLPSTLTSLGSNAFNIKISNPKYVVCAARTPPPVKSGYNAFTNSLKINTPLFVPENSIGSYKSARDWKDFKSINAYIVPTDLSLNHYDKIIEVGESFEISATIYPENVYDTSLTWSSSNSEIATVNNGKVKGIKEGETIITVSTVNGISKECLVKVVPPKVEATSITLNPSNLTLFKGEEFKLTATVLPENTTDKTITWASDNEAIVKVSADGTVTAVSVGVANITATCGEVSATCEVTVNPVFASGVTLNVQDIILLVGQSDKLTATVLPENTTDKTITWSSDNEAIAKVSADGTVTAVSIGVANITATCGEAKATCKVTVNPVPASGVSLNIKDMTLMVGQTDKLTATVLPENTTDKTITWKSDSEAIATVSTDGTVTAVSVGVANITATCGEATATCKVTVNPVPASGVNLNVKDMTLLVGQSNKLTATVLPENTTDKTITWSSDNEAIVKVSADGTVTAVSVGVANITATCGEATATCKVTVNPVPASGVTLNVQDMTLLVGQTDKLTATVLPENTTDKTITWTSDNEAIAKVSEDGTVTAVSVGVANITATCGEATATCKVTVNPVPASGVTLNVQDMTLMVGQTDKLTATVLPENTTAKTITWTSDNESIAKVSADGTVTAISVGVANITATCGEAKATCKVTVNPVPASGVSLNVKDMTLMVGQTDKLTATVLPENTTDKTMTWSSDNEAIAKVSVDGTVTAISVGVANISATCGEATATCKVTVNPVPASGVTLNVQDMTLLVGQTDKLTATVLPANTTDKTITWTSDNEAIAKVSEDGTVTAMSVGVANITATCGEATATCKVTVNPVPASGVSLNVKDMTLMVGQSDKLTATVLPENTTDKTITWKSDNEAIAKVSADGTVTAVSVGVANITATCGEASASCKVTANPVPASGITINAQDMSLLVGQSDKLTATVLPANTTDKTITWTSDNEAIAKVSEDGTVTAVSVGVANITATSGDATATCKVTVNPVPASGVTLNVQDKTLMVGQSDKLTATIQPENTTDKTITWSSDNEAIVKVSSDGTVTAVSVGIANITATCGEASATCKVTVNPVPASGVTLNVQDMTLMVGQTDKLTATVLPENTTDKTITWTSDNEAIAKVSDDGIVTAVSVGVASITATCGEATATCKVTVNPVPASGVTLNVQDMTLMVGQTDKLTATVLPENTTDKTITWKSDDEAIAKVSVDGTVTAISVGVANITATCGEAKATCKVTVNPVPASGVTLNVQYMTLLVGQSDKLAATVLPENTTDKTITWTSDNEAIAKVSEDGTVTAVLVGVANITATCGEAKATCKVTVNPVPASDVTLNVQDITLMVGQSDKLIATVLPENTTDKSVSWSSNNEAIATVSADGTVTAISVGVANITATCGDATATCKVTVNPVPASSIELSHQDITLLIGSTVTLTAKVLPENATNKEVAWSSADPSIVSVDASGTIIALKVGETLITASCGEVSATCKVTVNPIVATSISLNVKDETIFVASSTQLVATISPANVTDKTITWSSSKPEIATVSDQGIVSGVAVGTTTVTATIGSVSATCQINVVHRIPDMDPAVTTSERDIKTLSGTPVNMAVYSEGGEPAGWSYTWTKNGQTVSESSELNITAKNESETVIAETYRVKVENEIDKVIIFSEVYDFVVQIYPTINDSAEERDITISTGTDSADKTREGNTIRLSVATPTGGNANGWEYVWTNAQGEIGQGESIETVAAMSPGTSMGIEETVYKVQLTNYGPDDDIWAQLSSESTLQVYRRPETPLQLLRKGDGKSHTFVVMMPMSDSQLTQLEYKYVYGWTDSNGIDHSIDVTDLRYCRAAAEVYDDSTNKFWVYSVWNYQDGSVVSSGRRYLDGTVDESFDGSNFDGTGLSPKMVTDDRSAVFTLDGQYLGTKITNLSPGIYIYKSEVNGVMSTQKLIIH